MRPASPARRSAADSHRQAFESSDLFKDLSPEQLARVFEIARPERFKQGQTVIREGEAGDALYLLVEGEAEVSRTLTLRVSSREVAEQEKSLLRIGAGGSAFFGELGLLSDAPRSATVVAITPCVFFRINRSDFERVAQQEPSVAYQVVRRIAIAVAHRLRVSDTNVLKLATALSLALKHR